MLLVLSIVLLNLFDALMTLCAVGHGYGREVNPLFTTLVFTHPLALVAGKIIIPSVVCSYARVRYWWLGVVRWEMRLLAAAYAALALWHVYGYYAFVTGRIG